ncbi:hypothetical protein GGX14DRAFT_406427 [Mycena pura]|uniref:Uncharacterized protein n=1 Tax=Mycena pura TaxID=153505 RepID=A0AAD6UU18_9AGAR|nr:hypothetical protein GGX14DRAFT_406427 [Mycena pura]
MPKKGFQGHHNPTRNRPTSVRTAYAASCLVREREKRAVTTSPRPINLVVIDRHTSLISPETAAAPSSRRLVEAAQQSISRLIGPDTEVITGHASPQGFPQYTYVVLRFQYCRCTTMSHCRNVTPQDYRTTAAFLPLKFVKQLKYRSWDHIFISYWTSNINIFAVNLNPESLTSATFKPHSTSLKIISIISSLWYYWLPTTIITISKVAVSTPDTLLWCRYTSPSFADRCPGR